MKYSHTLLILLSFIICSTAISQVPPKGVNMIKVSGKTFNQAAVALLDAGYIFKSIDSNYKTLITEPKSYSKKTGGMMQLYIRQKDSTIIIIGFCGLQEIDFESTTRHELFRGKSEIENKGMKGSLMKESFDAMNKFAKSLGGAIEYMKE